MKAKNVRHSLLPKLFLILLVFHILASPAYGYIDPGTGSYVLQVVLAFLLGALFALKMFWRNVKAFFIRLFTGLNDLEDDAE